MTPQAQRRIGNIYMESYERELAFFTGVAAGREKPPSLIEQRVLARTLDAVRTSADEGREVRLADPRTRGGEVGHARSRADRGVVGVASGGRVLFALAYPPLDLLPLARSSGCGRSSRFSIAEGRDPRAAFAGGTFGPPTSGALLYWIAG